MHLIKMKGIDIFCAPQASTAISLSMEQGSSSSSSPPTLLLTAAAGSGGPAIDRHNPIITDSRRAPKPVPPRPTSQPPLGPKTQKSQNKKKKKSILAIPFKENEDRVKENKVSDVTVEGDDGEIKNHRDGGDNGRRAGGVLKQSWRCTKAGDFISPPGSTRYLLREKVFVNDLSDFDSTEEKFDEEDDSVGVEKTEEVFLEKSPSPSEPPEQVVYLKVSLHCRGCERKLRKHLTKMAGVTSFNIDFMAKKVTVTGKVTPSGVLSSISKVKNAQLWNPTLSTTPYATPYATPLSHNLIEDSDFQNEFKVASA